MLVSPGTTERWGWRAAPLPEYEPAGGDDVGDEAGLPLVGTRVQAGVQLQAVKPTEFTYS